MLANAYRSGLEALNIKILPKSGKIAANTLTAAYYPEGINGNDVLSKLADDEVIVAGGLLADLKSKYFRVGHMGAVSANDLISVLGALERVLIELGHPSNSGDGIKAFQNELLKQTS